MKKDSFKNQTLLFEQEATPHQRESRDMLHRQLIQLGDMMGDGLHYEPGGKWIVREYNKIAKAIIPEIAEKYRKIRQMKAKAVNESMKKLLAEKKCPCGGELEQSRSGSKIAYCIKCKARYKAGKKKKNSI